MSFFETRLNNNEIVYDTIGGPQYSTDVVVVRSGYEARNVNWAEARPRFELGERRLRRSELDTIIKFFRVMQGRGHGFRFKDWADYQVAASEGLLGTGVGTGLPTYQMAKRYAAGGQNRDRKIIKPVASPVAVMYRNGIAIGGATYSTITGIATLPAVSSFAITGITKANPGVVSAPGHTFVNGNQIYIANVVGMTQVNNTLATIAGVASGVFNLGIDTTAYSTYVSGGTAYRYPQAADALTWSGEFDIPVRFDTDELRTRFEAMEGSESLHYLFSLPVIELRL